MNTRVITFIAGAAILALARLFLFRARRRGIPFMDSKSAESDTWTLWKLVLASFLTLFAELACIRWIAVEVRIFAYFKNLALLLCFLGFGLGCALANRPRRWRTGITAFFGLLLVVLLPWHPGQVMETLSQNLGAAPDLQIWGTAGVWNWMHFLIAALIAMTLFLLLVWIFVPLGQVVSRQISLAPRPLPAYSWNLVGSLAGILAFLGLGRAMLPPWVWLGFVVLGFALLQDAARDRKLVMLLLVPSVLILYEPEGRDHFRVWTPYQQIQYSRVYGPNKEFLAGVVHVNHVGYQWIVDLSDAFLSHHAGLLKEAVEDNPYNLPFRFSKASPSVLIVGAGTGNDSAAALRHGSRLVDAVEIDPAILTLGKKEHPERPYDSPRVRVFVTDARAFLKRTRLRYDLVLFGLLDSHTQLSDYSNMRIDNFVYTEESFREAREHLAADGVMFVKFYVNRLWMAQRLAKMMKEVFGKDPLVFQADSSYSMSGMCFVISPSDRIETVLAGDPRLAQFVNRTSLHLGPNNVPATTDDWPYLYQQEKRIPRTYLLVSILVMLLAVVLYRQIPEARSQVPSLFFFFMGAGFLLLETQVVSRLALYFGTTWQVNGIVISALLIALLAANVVMERSSKPHSPFLSTAGLLIGLLMAYWLPFSRIPAQPAVIGGMASAVFAIPVFFAGLLFSGEFRFAKSPSAALGANMLGAVLGGLLENLSLLMGMRALLLLTAVLYCVAVSALLRGKKARVFASEATVSS